MNRLRVLHVIPALAARYGGPSVAVLEMCRALRARGIETLIATTDADGPGRLAVATGQVQTHDGLPVIFFPRLAIEGFQYSPALSSWLDAHVTDFDVVQIHAVFSHSSVAAARAARRHAVPYILRPLGSLDPWSLAQKQLQKRLFMRLCGRVMCRHAEAIAYTTSEERRLAEAALNLTRGIVTPLGLPDRAFATVAVTRASDEPYVLTLGRLHPKKGLESLIRAFTTLVADDRYAAWKLVIGGDGDPEFVNRLKALAGADGLRSRVSFAGWLDGLEKTRVLDGASLFAMPSAQENFGIAAVEAMARGVPVLVSPGVNLAGDIDAAAAGWVAEADVPALTAALRSAMGDLDARARRGLAARRFAESYRWSVVIDALITAYRAATARVPRPDAVAVGVHGHSTHR